MHNDKYNSSLPIDVYFRVKELHTSAEELAHHLRCIIEEVERTRTALNVGPSREISIQYTSVGISDEPQECAVLFMALELTFEGFWWTVCSFQAASTLYFSILIDRRTKR